MTHEIAVVPGDGVGREVVPAAVEVLDVLDVDLSFTEARAGDAVAAETGEPLPAATRETVAAADATLFGAAGETAADVVLSLREAVGSYANVRPVRSYPGVDDSHAPVDAANSDVDLVVVRENTEGVYAGIEGEVADGVTTLTRVVTEDASRKIAEFGFRYAEREGYDRVTVAHKANVMTTTDGLFLETAAAVGERFDVECDDALLDALAMHLVTRPEEYAVVVCPNLAGDVLSDLAAGLVGGLGLVPSANVGPENGLFEPVHGTAPDIAGEGVANPVAAVLSAALLLEHLGESGAAADVREAVESALAEGPRTPDVGGTATTDAVTAAIVERL